VSVTTGEDAAESRRHQLALLTELREIEYWRRLIAARIDLAVAAVAAVDEPVVRNLLTAPAVPFGLRDLVGLSAPGQARGEVDALLRLRSVQRDLDAYAQALRTTTRLATHDLLSRLDDPFEPDARGPGTAVAPVIPLATRRRRPPEPDGVA
jgi:hypothetical protein